MIDDYFTALKTQIEGGTGLSGRGFDTVRLDGDGNLIRDNYFILYSPSPVGVPQERFTEVQTYDGAVEFDCDVRVVGVNPGAVRLMLDRVMGRVVGHMLTITGRQPAKVTASLNGRLREDQSVKPFLYYQDITVEWVSRPA